MKKLLIISYFSPPMGMGNVVRVVKFAKYFPSYNWSPYLITSTPKTYYAKDDYLIRELDNSDINVIRTPVRKKHTLLNSNKLKRLPNERTRRFFSRFPLHYKIPDAHSSWKRKAIKAASRIIEREKIDIIFSSAPPFTDFIVGVELKKKYGIPLVVDYRDSWMESSSIFHPTRIHEFMSSKKELEVLRTADVILTVNRRIKELLIERYPNLTHNDINIVPFGYDQEDFDEATSQLPRTNKMRFTHAGSFFDLMTPKYFLEGLALAFDRRPELRKKVETCFLGVLSKENLRLISKFGLTDSIYAPGYVNHKECIKYLMASDILWLMLSKGRGSESVSPQRLSEYFGARKPIIACVGDGASKGMLRYYNAVKICEPDRPDEIAGSILEYYDLFEKNALPVPNEDVVVKHDIKYLTHQLVRYFEFLMDIAPQQTFSGKKVPMPIR